MNIVSSIKINEELINTYYLNQFTRTYIIQQWNYSQVTPSLGQGMTGATQESRDLANLIHELLFNPSC